MSGFRRVLVVTLCLLVAMLFAAPAFAQREVTKRDLQGISPKRHRYIFAVLGGAAVGAGIGSVLGGGPAITRGLMIGGGATNGWYLMTHREPSYLKDWGFIFGNTALVGGLGWTLCDCDDGLVAGALIGGGGTAAWEAIGTRNRRTAYMNPPPPPPPPSTSR